MNLKYDFALLQSSCASAVGDVSEGW